MIVPAQLVGSGPWKIASYDKLTVVDSDGTVVALASSEDHARWIRTLPELLKISNEGIKRHPIVYEEGQSSPHAKLDHLLGEFGGR